MKTTTALKRYGFTDNESLIYLYLLEHIEATAVAIARDTHIPKTTVYHTLEALKNQQFISSFKKNNITHFTPESPARLKSLLQEKQDIIAEVMPDLLHLSEKHVMQPVTKLYTGKEGLKIVYEESLRTIKKEKIKKRYLAFNNEVFAYLPKYLPKWIERKETLKVHSSVIFPDHVRYKKNAHPTYKPNNYRSVRYFPEQFIFEGSIEIDGSQISFFSVRDDELYSIMIKSPTMAKTLTQLFLYIWNTLEE